MLPNKHGFTIAEEIRALDQSLPIIYLTAKAQTEDLVKGFQTGGNDYIRKPFSMEELLMRIQAVLRRSMKSQAVDNDKTQFTVGQYIFNTETQTLKCGEENFKLTTKEAQLLRLLALNRKEVVDRSFTLKQIWHDDNYFNSRSMDVYITKLRKYLKHDQKVEIVNVHGKGLKLLINP